MSNTNTYFVNRYICSLNVKKLCQQSGSSCCTPETVCVTLESFRTFFYPSKLYKYQLCFLYFFISLYKQLNTMIYSLHFSGSFDHRQQPQETLL